MPGITHFDIGMWIFIACCVVQLLYYFIIFFRLNFVKASKGISDYLPPVSVVICAKNEATNLEKFLKVVLIQQYKQYEVIVVNDQSEDETIDVLVEYYRRNRNLKIVNIEQEIVKKFPGKKEALLRGIEAAAFDTIVVTDADCKPSSTLWLAKMVGCFMSETNFVLGHAPFFHRAGFLNKVIRYENSVTSMLYLGLAKVGIPYMGVGRNLAYKKETLTNYRGFFKHRNIQTGDDDLLVNTNSNAKNTEICIDKDAFTFSEAADSLPNWINQKRRHLRSGFRYKILHIILLFLFSLSVVSFYPLLIYNLLTGSQVVSLFAVAGFTLLAKWLFTFRVFKKLGSPDLWLISPVLDGVYAIYLVVIFFLLLLKPKDNWK